MRVDRVSAPSAAPANRKAPPRAGFAALLEEALPPRAAEAAEQVALAPEGYAAAALAEAADRHARRHGKAMLQALAALQLAVLGGGEGQARAHLADLAACPANAEDPVLRLILREIGARAAVELARGGT